MAEELIYQQIPKIMAAMSAIGKTQKNRQQNYSFRGIDDVYNALHGLLAEYGIFTVPEVLEERHEERESRGGGTLIYRVLRIKYTFYASDGSSVGAVVMGEAMDSGDKASNKAMAAAHKYAFFQVFAIPTGTEDADAETHEVKAVVPAPGGAVVTPDDTVDRCFKGLEVLKAAGALSAESEQGWIDAIAVAQSQGDKRGLHQILLELRETYDKAQKELKQGELV